MEIIFNFGYVIIDIFNKDRWTVHLTHLNRARVIELKSRWSVRQKRNNSIERPKGKKKLEIKSK